MFESVKYVWLCLVINCVFVVALPSNFIDERHFLNRDDGAEYSSELYDIPLQEHVNKIPFWDQGSDRLRLKLLSLENNLIPQTGLNNFERAYYLAIRDVIESQKQRENSEDSLLRAMLTTYKNQESFKNELRPWRGVIKTSDISNIADTIEPVKKRQTINCDVSQMTLNMLVEYFKNRTLCGRRTSQVRFGLGRK